MNKLIKSALYLSTSLAVAAALPVVTPALAADEAAVDDAGFDAIVVTATRREERLQDVPISITVFNQQQVSDANITNASDLAIYTPSLSADTRYGTENSTFSIRGFTQEIRTAPSVGVFFADVVAPRSGSTGLPAGDGAGPGSLFDLQNVQVLKGPQGTLFGRNTTGGDVLLVPVKPGSEFGGYVEGSIGNYDMRRLQGALNVPVNDTMRLRLGFDRQKRDGYLKNMGPGPDLADTNYTALRASFVWDITPEIENYTVASYINSDTHGSAPKVNWYNQGAITAYESALAAYNSNPTMQTRQDLFRAAVVAALPMAARDQMERMEENGGGFWSVDSFYEDPSVKTEQWQVINTTTWHASDTLTIKNIASYSEFRQANASELWGANFIVPDLFPLTDPDAVGRPMQTASTTPAPGNYTAAQKNITEELQFQGRELDGRLTWQAGAYMELSNPMEVVGSLGTSYVDCPQPLTLENVSSCINPYALNGIMPPNFYGGGATLSSGWQKYRDYALYAQASYELTDKLKLTGGFRYTWDKTIGMGENINFIYTVDSDEGYVADTSADANWMRCVNPSANLADNCRVITRQSSNAPTWLIELQYNPTSRMMTYAKYSRGYRQGGVLPMAPEGLDTFEAEKVDAYEIGAKMNWGGAMPGMLDIAAFYNDFANQQLQLGFNGCMTDCSVTVPTYLGGTRATSIVNAGSSRIYGVEFNASVSPVRGLRVSLAYSYLNSLLKEFDTTAYEELAAAAGLVSLPSAAEGEALTQTPKHKATISVTYELPIPQEYGKVSLGSTFAWSDRYLTTAPITSSTPSGSDEPYADESSVLNFNINWTSIGGRQIDGALFVTNALNEKYIVARGTRQPGFEDVYVGQPRMYGMRLRYNF